ncbi:MAG: hypothetical protein SPL35_03265 [Bacteroidales bacterium]|nr:hypothetical protein [Bacteroidales bacterium]
MKKTIIIFANLCASILIISCSKNDVDTPVNNEVTVEFNATSIKTKAAFTDPSGTTYPTLWTDNDASVKILQNVGGTPVTATVTPDTGHASAKFTASLTSDDSGSYTFYAVSPASAFTSYTSSYKNFVVTVSGNQTPSAKSVDEGAMLIAAKSSTYSPDFPTSVDLSFTHATAYGKLTLTDLDMVTGETIKTVKLTTASTKWTGSGFYYIEDYSPYSAGDLVPASTASKELLINTSSASDIWFACMPADLGGEGVTVLVTTNKYTYTKTITIPPTKKFEAGKIASFTVNMASAVKADAAAYILTPATGGTSSYNEAGAAITINGVNWYVTGNSTMIPWRIGGKKSTLGSTGTADRPIYSATAIPANISKIVITHGNSTALITVNSMTVYVCSSAEGAAADTPTDVVASFTPTFANDDDVEINKVGTTSWVNCYYRIVYNMNNTTNSQKYILFSEAKFYE